jgi:hypothetical protein
MIDKDTKISTCPICGKKTNSEKMTIGEDAKRAAVKIFKDNGNDTDLFEGEEYFVGEAECIQEAIDANNIYQENKRLKKLCDVAIKSHLDYAHGVSSVFQEYKDHISKTENENISLHKQIEELHKTYNLLWERCHIIFYPLDFPREYPIEHNPPANKNCRELIEKSLQAIREKVEGKNNDD